MTCDRKDIVRKDSYRKIRQKRREIIHTFTHIVTTCVSGISYVVFTVEKSYSKHIKGTFQNATDKQVCFVFQGKHPKAR